jgi:2-polyprenyl-3-methyl-5-hydroxy-6-metoxy-1,4-benzoquinol methylase
MEHESACPVCAAPTRPWARKGDFTVRKCTACGHGFATPRPSRIKTNRFYMDVALEDALESESYRRRARAGREEPAFVARRLARLGVTGGRLLDVGAGVGRFSAHFQTAGFEVTPLEIHPLLAGRIEDETGLSVVRQPFEVWQPDEGLRFDAIVISQVLEHVVEPGVWLARATELLSPGGVLFASIPNFGSLLVALLGAKEGNICPPTHINFFTRRSFTKAAAEHGLTLLRLETPSVLPAGPAIDAVAAYLRLPGPAAVLPGLGVRALLGATDPFGLGRFLHGYFRAS